MTPILNFVLESDTQGQHQALNPLGWKELAFVLERDNEGHDVIESIEGTFVFIGEDAVFLRNCILADGIYAIIRVRLSMSYDGYNFTERFVGVLDILEKESITGSMENKVACEILQEDMWTNFKARKDMKVDLESTLSVDELIVGAVPQVNIRLDSQELIRETSGYFSDPEFAYVVAEDDFLQWDIDVILLDELTKYNLPMTFNSARPVWMFEIEEYGDYTFDVQVNCIALLAYIMAPEVEVSPFLHFEFYFQKNDEAAVLFTHGSYTPGDGGIYTFNDTVTLRRGDLIRFYGVCFQGETGGADQLVVIFKGNPDGDLMFLNVSGLTVGGSVVLPAFRLLDAFKGVMGRITNLTPTDDFDYLQRYALMKGWHIRGYNLTAKPFSISFNDLWGGADPIFCLGYGYDEDGYFQIRDRQFFYNKSGVSVSISNINKIIETYDAELIISQLKLGYKKFESESMQNPQSKRSWRNVFRINKTKEILSGFVAASSVFEDLLRTYKKGDTPYDNEIFILSFDETGLPVPELDENFTDIENLEAPETKYNLRLSCARIFNRFKKWIAIMFFDTSGDMTFNDGEGNTTMISTLNDGTPEAGDGLALAENQNFSFSSVLSERLFLPVFGEAEGIPFSMDQYDQILLNRRLAIALSEGQSGKDLLPNLTEFDEIDGIGEAWTISSEPSVDLESGISGSNTIGIPVTIPKGITFDLDLEILNTSVAALFTVKFRRAGSDVLVFAAQNLAVGLNEITLPVLITEDVDEMTFVVYKTSGAATTINIESMTLLDLRKYFIKRLKFVPYLSQIVELKAWRAN